MHDATFSKEQLLRLKVATCSEMAQPQGATAKSSRGKRRKGPTLELAASSCIGRSKKIRRCEIESSL